MQQYLSKVQKLDPNTAKAGVKNRAAKRILENVKIGKEVSLNPRDAVIRLLNNDCKEANYIYHSGVLYVVIDSTVVTCYPYAKEKTRKFRF